MENLEQQIIAIQKDIFYFALRRLQDEDLANDITQNVLEKILKNMNQLKNPESFRNWALKITDNEIKLYFRSLKQYNRRFTSIEEEVMSNIRQQVADIADLEADLLQILLRKEAHTILMHALEQIQENYRQVIYLNIFCEYNFIEIAEIMNSNVNTVRTWYARGLLKLKEKFTELNKGGV